MNELQRRKRRLRRAHVLIRAELAVAFSIPVVTAFLYLAAPNFPGGGMHEPPLIETLMPWASVGLLIVGLVWMIRLSRPDPEAGERSWRYRVYD